MNHSWMLTMVLPVDPSQVHKRASSSVGHGSPISSDSSSFIIAESCENVSSKTRRESVTHILHLDHFKRCSLRSQLHVAHRGRDLRTEICQRREAIMNTINFNDNNRQSPHAIPNYIYDFYGRSCHIHGSNLSFLSFKGPKGDEGLAVSWGFSFCNIFLWNSCLSFFFFCRPPRNRYKICRFISVNVLVILYDIQCVNTPSSAQWNSNAEEKMIMSPADMKFMPYCLASGNPWILSVLQMPFPPFWRLKTIHTVMETSQRFCHPLEFFILMGPIVFFYCFVAPWFFTKMLIWHFNKLREQLQFCGGIASIRLTADPLSGPLSP